MKMRTHTPKQTPKHTHHTTNTYAHAQQTCTSTRICTRTHLVDGVQLVRLPLLLAVTQPQSRQVERRPERADAQATAGRAKLVGYPLATPHCKFCRVLRVAGRRQRRADAPQVRLHKARYLVAVVSEEGEGWRRRRRRRAATTTTTSATNNSRTSRSSCCSSSSRRGGGSPSGSETTAEHSVAQMRLRDCVAHDGSPDEAVHQNVERLRPGDARQHPLRVREQLVEVQAGHCREGGAGCCCCCCG